MNLSDYCPKGMRLYEIFYLCVWVAGYANAQKQDVIATALQMRNDAWQRWQRHAKQCRECGGK